MIAANLATDHVAYESITVISNVTEHEYGSDGMTILAMQLEACMLSDADAQTRYAAIYGEPWLSLYDLQCEVSRHAGETTEATTQAGRVLARGTR